ncbi:hypothetical protein LUU34_01297900 [Aix galericulata]|nr:hypothetical protein LUU34_01297900 [Aix galericulata]
MGVSRGVRPELPHLLSPPCRAGRCDGDAAWGQRSSTGGGGAGKTPGEEGGHPLGEHTALLRCRRAEASREKAPEPPVLRLPTAARPPGTGGKLPPCPPTWPVLGRGGQRLCSPAGPCPPGRVGRRVPCKRVLPPPRLRNSRGRRDAGSCSDTARWGNVRGARGSPALGQKMRTVLSCDGHGAVPRAPKPRGCPEHGREQPGVGRDGEPCRRGGHTGGAAGAGGEGSGAVLFLKPPCVARRATRGGSTHAGCAQRCLWVSVPVPPRL